MIYCRHVCRRTAKAALRMLAAGELTVLTQFDSLDALHAEVPFHDIAHLSVREELELLYWHEIQRGGRENLSQLRRLCMQDPALAHAYARLDRLAREGS